MTKGLRAVAIFVLASVAAVAHAQEWPQRPIRIIIPFPAGGPADVQARLIGPRLTEAWGQAVVVDNRAGANGIIGTDLVAKAAPDGYTFTIASAGHTINASLYRKIPYDSLADFAAIGRISTAPGIVVVHPSQPVKSVQELIAHARSRPGQVLYVSAGTGSPSHLAVELFKVMTQTDMVHIPYKGSTPATNDLLAGQVHVAFPTILAGLPHAKSGRLRALAVTSPERSRSAPDLPTVAEAGVPGYSAMNWYGVIAPARTPRAVVVKLNAQITQALAVPQVREQLLNLGIEPSPTGPDELAAQMKAEVAKWAGVIKTAGVTAE
jgi:tripartite-type tricarboxylate transporter receptor subunit TctC